MTLFSYEQSELENKKYPCGTEVADFNSRHLHRFKKL